MPGWTRKDFPVFKGEMTSLVRSSLHYIRNGDGRKELYDFMSDSLGRRDLASAREWQDSLAALGATLDSMLVKRKSGERNSESH